MGLLSHLQDARTRSTPAFEARVRFTSELTPRSAAAAGKSFVLNCLSCWQGRQVDLAQIAAGADADKQLVGVLLSGSCANCGSSAIAFVADDADDEPSTPIIFGRFPKQTEIARRGLATIVTSTRITAVPFGADYSANERHYRLPYLDLKARPNDVDLLPEVDRSRRAGRMIDANPQSGHALRQLMASINSIDTLSTLACSWEQGILNAGGHDQQHVVESWVEVARSPLAASTYGTTLSLAEALIDRLHAAPSGCAQSLNIAFAVKAARVFPVLQLETTAVAETPIGSFHKWERGVQELERAIITIVGDASSRTVG